MSITDKIQPATRLETGHVAVYTAVGTVLMWIVMFVLNLLEPDIFEYKMYTVILGGIVGSLVAVFNFFLMAITVQKVSQTDDEKNARSIMKTSYTRRMLLQILWMIIALLVPCFQWAAGILPLLFPSLGIKLKGAVDFKKNKRQEVEQKQDGD